MIRPDCLSGYTQRLQTPCGDLYLTLNEYKNSLCEVRMTLGKSGSCSNILFTTISILISKLLQCGVPKDDIKHLLYHQFEGRCGQKIFNHGEEYHSCIDYVITKMFEDMGSRGEIKLETE
jgi:ribonucleoside-diphosphate reductase alpha chain